MSARYHHQGPTRLTGPTLDHSTRSGATVVIESSERHELKLEVREVIAARYYRRGPVARFGCSRAFGLSRDSVLVQLGFLSDYTPALALP